ncbi:phenazine biosynthesis protein PhzF family [Kribbella flavida DSM 17836]|uniref:Phenazine biosynthesis protein PhzF family n=1 Tax=Kribbella flavida (strain DSM 17836 / JCM 10339 / NBRC 14399) TaxID=479435 RepID=D2PNG8_KRIFD|nr:PhzF family phenazine biosynthesis protein [Kribbella flavida]ADB30820.1 phenazine biosynthesis protein PhzF family [Kribbella flavida DSM 17836]
MTTLDVQVVRVFVDSSGAFGNPLGIVDGRQVPDADRQAVAAQLGYSETVFVDEAEAGRIRIFSATAEMPFAGHPTVGAAWWLHSQGHRTDVLRVPAGEVPVTRADGYTFVRAHATWGSTFDWHQLDTPPDVLAASPAEYSAGHTFLWAWQDEPAGRVRARVFAPAMGVPEDEATGSAATQLTARLGRNLHIVQGAGSELLTTLLPDDWTTVGGRVLPAPARTFTY